MSFLSNHLVTRQVSCGISLPLIFWVYFNIQLRPSEEVLGLFPEGNNPSGVDNFGYSPIQRTVTVFIIPNKQLKYTV